MSGGLCPLFEGSLPVDKLPRGSAAVFTTLVYSTLGGVQVLGA